ncbi:hypothetical protein C8Q70DRAFT_958354 [Cubamyces menziesii]|nr:hypothetical protein C8Q70DRAFT_958354 [Cubamyces menziesii]
MHTTWSAVRLRAVWSLTKVPPNRIPPLQSLVTVTPQWGRSWQGAYRKASVVPRTHASDGQGPSK